MKSYGEFCALSRGLDVVGDRWTMLIVRELLIGPCRYSDLQRSLPGIATNLLSQRLRSLEESGVVVSMAADGPTPANVYSLTEWGLSLRAPLIAIAQWASPLMDSGLGPDQSRARWLIFALMALYPDPAQLPTGARFPELSARIDVDGESLRLVSDASGVRAESSSRTVAADVVVEGASDAVFAVLSGGGRGSSDVRVDGGRAALQRFDAMTRLAYPAAAGLVR